MPEPAQEHPQNPNQKEGNETLKPDLNFSLKGQEYSLDLANIKLVTVAGRQVQQKEGQMPLGKAENLSLFEITQGETLYNKISANEQEISLTGTSFVQSENGNFNVNGHTISVENIEGTKYKLTIDETEQEVDGLYGKEFNCSDFTFQVNNSPNSLKITRQYTITATQV